MNSFHRRGAVQLSVPAVLLVGLVTLSGPSFKVSAAEATVQIDVDARELPRKLLHTKVAIPCLPGPLAFRYPKWIPGTHAPCGPIDSVGGLRVKAADGRVIPWFRDQESVPDVLHGA